MLRRLIHIAVPSCLLFLSSCSQEASLRSDPRPSQGADQGQLTEDEAPEQTPLAALLEKFKFFTTSYSFHREIADNAEYARTMFPAFDGEGSYFSKVDQEDLLKVRMDLLNAATKSVRLQTLQFWSDESTWLIVDKLIELHKKGVMVQVVVDAITNINIDAQRMFFYLEQNGVPVEGYTPFYTFPLASSEYNQGITKTIRNVNRRYHEKMLVIDAELPDKTIALMGGANLSKYYFRVDDSSPLRMWRDEDILLKGKAAVELGRIFDDGLKELVTFRHTDAILTMDYFWTLVESLRSQYSVDRFIEVKRPAADAKILAKIQLKLDSTPVLEWTQVDRYRFMRNRPRNNELYIEDAYLDMIDSSKNAITLVSPYIIPGKQFIESIKAAARRGVRVDILNNSPESSDPDFMVAASRALYKDMLVVNEETLPEGGGVHIYEWKGAALTTQVEGHVHAKFATFDQQVTIVGSYNLAPRSVDSDSEIIVATLSETLAKRYYDHAKELMDAHFSNEITLEKAKTFESNQTIIDKARSFMVRLLNPLL